MLRAALTHALSSTIIAVLLVAALLPPEIAQGQRRGRGENQAFVGPLFGVGKVTLPVGEGAWNEQQGLLLTERNGRIFYPAYSDGPIRQLFRSELGIRRTRVTVSFLFQGTEPLELTLYTPRPVRVVVRPVTNERFYSRDLRGWWREYTRAAKSWMRSGQYPPLVENYLTAMLSTRMGLPLPRHERNQLISNESVDNALGVLMGTEAMRDRMAFATMLTGDASQRATLPLPAGPVERRFRLPEPIGKIKIEPIALHVPRECFYVRFGSFENFNWFQSLMKEWGGDIRTMISARAVDFGQTEQMQTQLSLRQNALAVLFGGAVITDVAMIGRDMFFREGAAYGFLFQARNSTLLSVDFNKQRADTLKNTPGCTQVTVKIGGNDVPYLSTPDGKVRSYYAIDGDYHLVTTSRQMVERFYEAGTGTRALGDADAFKLARTARPPRGTDAAYVYLSREFFHGMLAPAYRVEMQRRLQSVVEMDLLRLARLAAKNEGKPLKTIEELVAGRYLPRGFGVRGDGSRLVEKDSVLSDSLRGRPGGFVPIPDVKVKTVPPSEATSLAQFTQLYNEKWQDVDPIVIAIGRIKGEGNIERLTIDAHITPVLSSQMKTIVGLLGIPSKARFAPVPGDAVSVQLAMSGEGILKTGPHHLFGGLNENSTLFRYQRGKLRVSWPLRNTFVGYLGSWPVPGALKYLQNPLGAEPDADGDYRGLFGTWYHYFDKFTVMSFHKEMLRVVAPRLRFEEAPHPAQVWVRVGDLAKTGLAKPLRQLGYYRARQVSQGNLQFLDALSQQLRVPPAEAMKVAEELVAAKLVCPLGGKYQPAKFDGGLTVWESTAWSRHQPESLVPDDYEFPLMRWFRGANVEGVFGDGMLSLHGEVLMQRKAASKKAADKDPFNPFSIFGG